jgi:ABC-type glutathione transport system ATPase component
MFPSPSTNAGRNRPADTSPFCCRKGRPMLQLINIEKKYTTGDLTQAALNGVSLNLRDSEFVAILGPSGSGKTTLLNIIGGLDRYDSGELIINGISTPAATPTGTGTLTATTPSASCSRAITSSPTRPSSPMSNWP